MTPGGIDSHVHLHQDNSPTGDKWLSGSRSALAGGNTTIIAFATQKRSDTSLIPVVEEYSRRASKQSYIDYGFHLILTNPTPEILTNELPRMMEQGISSVKLYMTYPAMKLGDRDMLEVMMTTRSLGMTTMIHAENADMIDHITARLLAHNHTLPKYHAIARPQLAESEATYRAIALSTLTSTPILLVHVSSPVALSHARKAQSKSLLPIHPETCPHYLYLLSSAIASTSHPPHTTTSKTNGLVPDTSVPLHFATLPPTYRLSGTASTTTPSPSSPPTTRPHAMTTQPANANPSSKPRKIRIDPHLRTNPKRTTWHRNPTSPPLRRRHEPVSRRCTPHLLA